MTRVTDDRNSDRVEAILRNGVLKKFGVRRDVLLDIFVKSGWRHGPNDAVEVVLKFKGTDKDIPPLRGLFVSANANEYIMLDRRSRHWALLKEKWGIVPNNPTDCDLR